MIEAVLICDSFSQTGQQQQYAEEAEEQARKLRQKITDVLPTISGVADYLNDLVKQCESVLSTLKYGGKVCCLPICATTQLIIMQMHRIYHFPIPAPFVDMIATLQWQEDAQMIFQFQIFYDLCIHLVRANELVHRSWGTLHDKSMERPPFVHQPPVEEDEDDVVDEYRYKAAVEDHEQVHEAIRAEVETSLLVAHAHISNYVSAWRADTDLLESGQLTAWRSGDEETRKKMLRSRFVAAMSRNRKMMHATTYEEKMREIRALALESTVAELETKIQQLRTAIEKLEELMS